MNKNFAYPLLVIVIAACSGGSSGPISKPYKFNRNRLDSLVKANKAIYNVDKRGNGTLATETYYLGDSAKFRLIYDEKSKLKRVLKYNEHGEQIWYENYYATNGQRMAHYSTAAFPEMGLESVEHGAYETYYDDGKVKEQGEYKKRALLWKLEFDLEGQPGDTTRYEYQEDEPVVKDTVAKPQKIKVEKIETATTPN